VIVVSPDDDLTEVMKKITTTGHMGYPVIENGKVVGIITLQDITKCPGDHKKVRDTMSRKPVVAYPDRT
jgi:CIC family chloride channel protein